MRGLPLRDHPRQAAMTEPDNLASERRRGERRRGDMTGGLPRVSQDRGPQKYSDAEEMASEAPPHVCGC